MLCQFHFNSALKQPQLLKERETAWIMYMMTDVRIFGRVSWLAKSPPPPPPPPCHLPGGILSPDGVTTSARGKSTRWHPLLFLINKKNHSIHLETATLSQEGIVNISQKMDVLSNCPFVSF